MDMNGILELMGFDPEEAEVTVFKNEEDGEDYAVWKIISGGESFVLKEAKKYETEIYEAFLKNISGPVPKLYKTANADGKTYILMEFIEGKSILNCTRKRTKAALDALMELQEQYWGKAEPENFGYSFEKSLESRKNRGKYLCDAEIEKAYGAFLEEYSAAPRTLCHDDLLPFNVLASEDRAVLIDWEAAGILPYLASFARFIAHGEEGEEAFFCMTEADRKFAVEYYYSGLIGKKGIPYEEYRRSLDLFLLYEYCEWVMLGNKYGDTDSEKFKRYYALAKEKAKEING